jgi:hypothetical protein
VDARIKSGHSVLEVLSDNADPGAGALDAAFEYIAHAQLAADLLRIDRPAPVSERSISAHHEHARDARQIGRQIFGDTVSRILLRPVIAQVGKRQYRALMIKIKSCTSGIGISEAIPVVKPPRVPSREAAAPLSSLID